MLGIEADFGGHFADRNFMRAAQKVSFFEVTGGNRRADCGKGPVVVA